MLPPFRTGAAKPPPEMSVCAAAYAAARFINYKLSAPIIQYEFCQGTQAARKTLHSISGADAKRRARSFRSAPAY
jgi:hypothetical protein